MTVGIIVNDKKQDAAVFAVKLQDAFKAKNIDVVQVSKKDDVSDMVSKANLIITVGGDGTFLRAASKTIERGIPVLGFNLGTLGFLTEFEKESIEETVSRIATGDYSIEERRVISANVVKNGEKNFFGYAVNDVVLTRESDANVAYLNLKIKGVSVDTFPCDGIIVATQTGSTGYALSAGGPIVEPGNDVIIISPICSHKMGSRAIVAGPQSPVEIIPVKAKRLCLVIDGKTSCKIGKDEYVLCEPTDKKVKIVRIDPPNFYKTVQNKLLGGNANA